MSWISIETENPTISNSCVVELRGFEPMAIAGRCDLELDRRWGDWLARSRLPPAEDLPFAWPPLGIGEEERTFVIISA
jgi:hypothetical protein